MSREIDLLTTAAARGLLVVEKETNCVWELEKLYEAQDTEPYQAEDHIVAVDAQTGVTSPYPGCLQEAAGVDTWSHFRAVGQTQHFVLFERTPDGSQE
jgi:hypothetical protein